AQLIERLHKKHILVSLFVSPEAADIRTAAKLGADIVELCTRDYSEATSATMARKKLQDLALSTLLAKELGLEVHAGHGLDYHNVLAVADLGGITCMNIGFAIITRALFAGLPTAVSEMKGLL
ncbi:MAG: pyridoxine 5'-phosphate synthase, partial [Elusimicrobiaceae bacterium]|nr:pyridoxine 5'-phosphate synthase [Elusimicrobiaceae bacterium]